MVLLSAFIAAVLALLSATLCYVFGLRMADKLPGETSWPECLYCQRKMDWRDILPIIGWLRTGTLSCPCGQRGKQWHRPALEISAIILGTLAGLMMGPSPQLFWISLAIGLLLALALIDFQLGIIPDALNATLAALGFFWLLSGGGEITVGLVTSGALLLLGLLLALGYSKWRGKEMLGLGDVKYFAAVGLWLTPSMVPWFLCGAGVLGAINGLLWQRLTGQEKSPFAPALVAATLLTLFYLMADQVS